MKKILLLLFVACLFPCTSISKEITSYYEKSVPVVSRSDIVGLQTIVISIAHKTKDHEAFKKMLDYMKSINWTPSEKTDADKEYIFVPIDGHDRGGEILEIGVKIKA